MRSVHAIDPAIMMPTWALCLAFALILSGPVTSRDYHRDKEDRKRTLDHAAGADYAREGADYWHQLNADEVDRALRWTSSLNTGVAKNVVLFIGDGMSVQTQTAARILKAQFYGGNFENPETEYLAFERLPHMGHSKVRESTKIRSVIHKKKLTLRILLIHITIL